MHISIIYTLQHRITFLWGPQFLSRSVMETSSSGQSCQLALVRRCLEKSLAKWDWGRLWGNGSASLCIHQAILNQKALNDREVDGFQGSFLSRPPCWSDEVLLWDSETKIAVSEYLYIWQQEYYFTVNAIFSMLDGWNIQHNLFLKVT